MTAPRQQPDRIVFFDFTNVVGIPSAQGAHLAGLATALGGIRPANAYAAGKEATGRTFNQIDAAVRRLPVETALTDVSGATQLFDPHRTKASFERSLRAVPVTPIPQTVGMIRCLQDMPGVRPVMLSDLPAAVLDSWMVKAGLRLDIERVAGDAIHEALMRDRDADRSPREAKVAGAEWYLDHPSTGAPPKLCMLVEDRREAAVAFLEELAPRGMKLMAVVIDPTARLAEQEELTGGRLTTTPPSLAHHVIEGGIQLPTTKEPQGLQ